MRKVVYVGFIAVCGIILFGKILNWFVDFDQSFSDGLNIAMFSVLGILWLSWAWTYDHKIIKGLFFIGGCYLLLHEWISIPDFLRGIFVVLAFLPWILVKIKPGRFA